MTHTDRLTRFGFKSLEKVLAAHGTSIIALHSEGNRAARNELSDDMTSLMDSFSGKVSTMQRKRKINPEHKKAIDALMTEFGRKDAAVLFQEGMIEAAGEENQGNEVPFEF